MVLGREYLAQRVVISPGSLRVPPVVADEAKLAIVFTYFFLLFSFLVQACLRAPHVVADEAKLAIVFTYFFLFSFFFFLFLLRLLLFTHFGESPVRENLFPPVFWHNTKIYAKI